MPATKQIHTVSPGSVNLLYLDAPNAGFSYQLVKNASDAKVKAAEFDAQNFNPFIDASQMIRVLLRFLDDHPLIKSNSVILVGESYGGVRASIMMNMLLFHNRYQDGTRVYRDASLTEEIRRHFANVYSSEVGTLVTPEMAAGQFGAQILISPLIAGKYQNELAGEVYEREASVIYRIAVETGTVYNPCASAGCSPRNNALDFVEYTAHRDINQYDKPAGFVDEILAFNIAGLNLPVILSSLFRCDITLIPYLGASYREEAYRYIKNKTEDNLAVINSPGFAKLPAPVRIRIMHKARALEMDKLFLRNEPGSTLEEVFGVLNSWDDYLIDCNESATAAFYDNSAIKNGYMATDPLAASMGELFLQNLALVRTLITDCRLDLVIYAPVIPDSLKRYPTLVKTVARRDDMNDGYIDVYYLPGSLADVETPQKRTIYFPRYASSGHRVTLAQPDKFFEDVQKWLSANCKK